MALKNMEYKAIDDSKVAAAEGGAAAQGDKGDGDFGNEEVQGFLFGRLVERKPELKAELLMCASSSRRRAHPPPAPRSFQRSPGTNAADPVYRPPIGRFRDTLLSAAMEEGDRLEVWEMKDLGLQATQRIAASVRPTGGQRPLSSFH